MVGYSNDNINFEVDVVAFCLICCISCCKVWREASLDSPYR